MAALSIVLLLTGCKVLVPYDSKFACEGTQDYGRCMDVQTAYEDALGTAPATQAKDKAGKSAPQWNYHGKHSDPSPSASPTLRRLKNRQGATSARVAYVAGSGADLYRETQYRELAGLIEESVTPIVQPPKVLRTLIVSYSAGDSLYMPRYVYYLADEAKFVLGDYLQGNPQQKIVYPNSAPLALSDAKK